MALADTQSSANAYTVLSQVLPTVAWAIFFGAILCWLREDLKGLISQLRSRIRLGASIKIASFELGSAYVAPGNSFPDKKGPIEGHLDDKGAFQEEAERFRLPTRNIFLVHRVAPSREPGQLYDIQIYLHPHKEATLAGVKKVDYYFGRYWGNHVFTSQERSSAFSIGTSAYGPFVCTARVHFSDGEVSTTWRYIDFEMGSVGAQLASEE